VNELPKIENQETISNGRIYSGGFDKTLFEVQVTMNYNKLFFTEEEAKVEYIKTLEDIIKDHKNESH